MPGQLKRRRAQVTDYDVEPEEADDFAEEEEERPARSSRRRGAALDEDQDERPRRSRRGAPDEDEVSYADRRDTVGRPRQSRRDDDDDDEPQTRRRSREEEDARPRRNRSDAAAQGSSRSSKGGAAMQSSSWGDVLAHRGANLNKLVIKDDPHLIKILEEQPFADYGQHWVYTAEGLRSYACGEKQLGVCPLCKLGTETRWLGVINVIDMGTVGKNGKITKNNAEHLYWEIGPAICKRLSDLADSSRTGPLDRDDMYFEVTRSKKSNGFYDYDIQPIKERDLDSDYGIEPLDAEETDEALDNRFGQEVIRQATLEELKAVARASKAHSDD